MNELSATVFDIQRFCVHDGPGIRTVVFFKGCSLACQWCQNPESLSPKQEVAFFGEQCIGCFECEAACPQGAILRGDRRVDWSRCDHCGRCAEACPGDALRVLGRDYGVEELVTACTADRTFAEASGGGVTLSGGEPVLHSAFLERLLPRLVQEGLPVLLETAGHYPWRLLEPLLPHLDAVYFDYKLPDSAAYEAHTGQGNHHIMNNLARLMGSDVPVVVRMPMVSGLNTEPNQIERTCKSLASVGVQRIRLLEYNRLWEAKLPRLSSRREALGLASDVNPSAIIAEVERHGMQAELT